MLVRTLCAPLVLLLQVVVVVVSVLVIGTSRCVGLASPAPLCPLCLTSRPERKPWAYPTRWIPTVSRLAHTTWVPAGGDAGSTCTR